MRDSLALPGEKELQRKLPWPRRGPPREPTEMPRPCQGKRSHGEGAPGRLQARSLGLTKRKGVPERDSSTQARATQTAQRQNPSDLPSEKGVNCEIHSS